MFCTLSALSTMIGNSSIPLEARADESKEIHSFTRSARLTLLSCTPLYVKVNVPAVRPVFNVLSVTRAQPSGSSACTARRSVFRRFDHTFRVGDTLLLLVVRVEFCGDTRGLRSAFRHRRARFRVRKFSLPHVLRCVGTFARWTYALRTFFDNLHGTVVGVEENALGLVQRFARFDGDGYVCKRLTFCRLFVRT